MPDSSPTNRHALVIVVDGWRASSLGAYGNSGLPTPTLDKIASQSLLLDFLLCDSVELPQYYRSLFNAEHSLRLNSLKQVGYSLLKELSKAGSKTSLLTDDSWLGEFADQLPLASLTHLNLEVDQPAQTSQETAMGQLFAIAGEHLAELSSQRNAGSEDGSQVTWIHLSGFHGPWDAPTEYRSGLLTDEDPPPLEGVSPPRYIATDDPDELLAYRAAYDAQVMVLEECLGDFLAASHQYLQSQPTLVCLTGSRGFALGEHGELGTQAKPLYGELLHVPCLISVPETTTPIPRFGGLCQPADLGATLSEWLLGQDTTEGRNLLTLFCEEPVDWRQFVLAKRGDEVTLRTVAWMMRTSGIESAASQELYVKPDDRWECNEISGLCPDAFQQLQALQEEVLPAFASGQPLPAETLAENLVKPHR
ncbi:sulfatase-like hydrolase/transferase [Adhaeretor mobilis]|uniref:Sulfatase n=1 Tax=Adhaeretor mobilis TaxID=1930276 RepID=A0A517MXE3_9BACT|nr:sulfatase-like hydrolase/transferase [Adhaeretor mobilis]QDS99533.1 Sulfatase [Adhaeretor mobilis]